MSLGTDLGLQPQLMAGGSFQAMTVGQCLPHSWAFYQTVGRARLHLEVAGQGLPNWDFSGMGATSSLQGREDM